MMNPEIPAENLATAEQVAAVIRDVAEKGKTVLVATHRRPDGDGVGCCLALSSLFERMGIPHVLYCPDPVPRRYRFLPKKDRFTTRLPEDGVTTVFALDAGRRTRILGPGQGDGWRIINVDHHYDNNLFGSLNWVRSDVSSVGEFLPELWEILGFELTADEATCLYTAVVTDTGSFQFPNTTFGSLARAAEFARKGVSPGEIANKIFCSTPIEAVRLMSRVLSTTEVDDKVPVAWMVVRRKDLEETGATYEEMERFADVPRSVVGASMGVLFVEEEDGMTHVSLRCKKGCDVSRIALRFGGGGHKQASAFDTRSNWKEALQDVLEAVKEEGIEERIA